MMYFLWVIGFVFTLGAKYTPEEAEAESWWQIILLFLFWPLFLGEFVRCCFYEDSAPEEDEP